MKFIDYVDNVNAKLVLPSSKPKEWYSYRLKQKFLKHAINI